MRADLWLGALGAAVLLLGGCGGGTASSEAPPKYFPNPTRLQVTLDGFDRPETAGILMADKLGYFDEVGLEVDAFRPATPTRPVEYVMNGTDDIGVTHQPQVVLAAEKGAPIVALGSLLSQPTMAMIWLKGSGIDGIAGLKGKTIGLPGPSFQESFLESFLRRGGLTLGDVEVKRVSYEAVPELTEGRVDAIFGGDWNAEGAQLEAAGLHPVITRVDAAGIPSYDELVVIARSDRVAEDPRPFRAFMAALARGTAAAVKDPKGMVELLEANPSTNPHRTQRGAEAEVKATLPLLSTDEHMDPEQAQSLIAWMREEGMIQSAPSASQLFDNGYLR